MDEEIFKYRINSVHLKDGDSFAPGKINIFVGKKLNNVLY